MARTSPLGLREIAERANLARAFWRAAAGKRERPEVAAFAADLDRQLAELRRALLEERLSFRVYQQFVIHDPKRRVIHAPPFRDRVVHHAVMQVIGPVLDRALIDDTFACREGKGTLAAVQRVREGMARAPWYVKVDVRRYFDSIDHARLLEFIAQRLRAPSLLRLSRRIIEGYELSPGKGLPIGALTSQHFANLYLAPLDRFLLEELRVVALVRYMDDLVWWCRTREEARSSLAVAKRFVHERLALEFKPEARWQRSAAGVAFCGFRIDAARLRLGTRRCRRYRATRCTAESAFIAGGGDARELQQRYAVALAMTAGAAATQWRREELQRRPPPEA